MYVNVPLLCHMHAYLVNLQYIMRGTYLYLEKGVYVHIHVHNITLDLSSDM